jgi:anti-anti-sigma factor
MSVFKSAVSDRSPATRVFSNLFEVDPLSRSLAIHMGKSKEIDDFLLTRFREEISRLVEGGDFTEIVFDLSGILVLPSSALGLIAAVSQGDAKVRVIHASHSAREDFQLTGLYRMIELEPSLEPPRK